MIKKDRLYMIGFALFLIFVIFYFSTADKRNRKLSYKICKFFNTIQLNHIVLNKDKTHDNHYLEEIYLRNLVNDSIIATSPFSFNIKVNIYDSLEIGDTLYKYPYGELLFIHKKDRIDTLIYNKNCSLEP